MRLREGRQQTLERGLGRKGLNIALVLSVAATLVLALSIAPLALGLGAVWFLWRLVSYATADIVEAEIVDWRHERSSEQPTSSVAYAQLQFIDHAGRERLVSSTVGIATDPTLASIDPLPEGPIQLRCRRWPFLALEDDKAVWFTGPCIQLATAVLGTMLQVLFRFSPFAWVMG